MIDFQNSITGKLGEKLGMRSY